MKKKLGLVCFATLMVTGCAHTTDDGFRFVPDKYVSNVEYNSIYHYGYNQGCESALAKKGNDEAVYIKDPALDGSNTRFNEGWDDGEKACSSGSRKTIYGLSSNTPSL